MWYSVVGINQPLTTNFPPNYINIFIVLHSIIKYTIEINHFPVINKNFISLNKSYTPKCLVSQSIIRFPCPFFLHLCFSAVAPIPPFPISFLPSLGFSNQTIWNVCGCESYSYFCDSKESEIKAWAHGTKILGWSYENWVLNECIPLIFTQLSLDSSCCTAYRAIIFVPICDYHLQINLEKIIKDWKNIKLFFFNPPGSGIGFYCIICAEL